jgi:predicted ATPase
LAAGRLITLTGPGGSGKTRLSQQIAAAQAGHRRHRADDEHLVEPCARLAAALIQTCPSLTILSTSREPLHVPGERLFPVPPLSLPETGSALTVAAAGQSEAVQLFVTRAVAVRPTFRLTPDNVHTVAEICRRLDGIPLALELAAARIKLLSAEEVAERLSDRFRLLTSSSAVILPRHQTLRAAVDWSHDLLAEQERLFFRRLAVFPGGWTVAAAEQVCTGDGIAADDALDLLGELVDKSLITVEEQHGALRYRLLETIREYAWEKLAASGEADAVCARREAWLLALAEQPLPEREGPALVARLLRLEQEIDNFRAALAWRLEGRDGVEAGLRLAAALGPFWEAQGGNAEGLRWLGRFLEACPAAPAALRASALFQMGRLASWSGDYERAAALLEESLALYRQTDDRRAVATVCYWLADNLQQQHENERAQQLLEQGLALYEELGDTLGRARTLRELAMVAVYDGDLARAESLCEQSLALYREMGDRHGMVQPLSVLVRAMFISRNYERAAEFAEQTIALSEDLASRQFRANLLVYAGMVQSALGNVDRALELERESLRLVRDSGTKLTIHTCLGAIGAALHRAGRSEQGARLLSAAIALLDSLNVSVADVYRPLYEATVRSVQRRLDEETFARAWAAGHALPLDAAIAEALDESVQP